MISNRMNRAVAFILTGVISLVFIATIATTACAEFDPIEIRTVMEDDDLLIIKTFDVPTDTDIEEALKETDLELDGKPYQLRDIEQELVTGQITNPIEKTIEKRIPNLNKEAARKEFDDVIDENGVQLKIDDKSITIRESEIKDPIKSNITETRTITGLRRNDPALIPKTLEKGGQALQLESIKWILKNGHEDSESIYEAHAVYTGYSTKKNMVYIATATYIGEPVKDDDMLLVTLTYEPQVINPLPDTPESKSSNESGNSSEPELLPNPTSPTEEENPINWMPVYAIIIGLFVSAVLFVLIVLYVRHRDFILKTIKERFSKSQVWEDEDECDEMAVGALRLPEAMKYMHRPEAKAQVTPEMEEPDA